jgi:hypothetical protein
MHEFDESIGGRIAGQTQGQTGVGNEFDVGSGHWTVNTDGQEGRWCQRFSMLFDPSLDGLIGAVELSCDLGDRVSLLEDLFDGGALNGEGVTRLFFRHGGFWKKWNRDGRFDNTSTGKIVPTLNTLLLEGIRDCRSVRLSIHLLCTMG